MRGLTGALVSVVAALAVAATTTLLAGMVPPHPVAATGYCSDYSWSTPTPGRWWKNLSYAYAEYADLEHYENQGANTACWYSDDIANPSSMEGVDCSGFVGKVWGLWPNGGYVNSSAWYSWNPLDTRRVISTANLWGINTSSFGTSSFALRGFMDAGVARTPTGSHGHVFIELLRSSDGSNDWIIDASSASSTPQVGFRVKNVSAGYYGVVWEWKFRKNWA